MEVAEVRGFTRAAGGVVPRIEVDPEVVGSVNAGTFLPVVGIVMFVLSSMRDARALALHGLEYRIEVHVIAEVHELLAQGADVDP